MRDGNLQEPIWIHHTCVFVIVEAASTNYRLGAQIEVMCSQRRVVHTESPLTIESRLSLRVVETEVMPVI